MTTETRSAETGTPSRPAPPGGRPNRPTAERVHRNLTNLCRDQIIGAVQAENDERLDYWLARYVELVGKEASTSDRE